MTDYYDVTGETYRPTQLVSECRRIFEYDFI